MASSFVVSRLHVAVARRILNVLPIPRGSNPRRTGKQATMAVPLYIAILEAEARFMQLRRASRLAAACLRSARAATHDGAEQ